jgi:Predicted nucleic acid-binding protein, contains PIN domain
MMTVVIDAGVALAALLDDDEHTAWAREVMSEGDLAAPELLSVEVAHLLRKSVSQGLLTAHKARDALVDLLDVVDDFYPHGPFVPRIWELHATVTSYDSAYVALAEALAAPLATLDQKLRNATGPRCEFLQPS